MNAQRPVTPSAPPPENIHYLDERNRIVEKLSREFSELESHVVGIKAEEAIAITAELVYITQNALMSDVFDCDRVPVHVFGIIEEKLMEIDALCDVLYERVKATA